MEIANASLVVRTANQMDARSITRLLSTAAYRHRHDDWNLPSDWLGSPSFALAETANGLGVPALQACLLAAADPPPAAWVRVAAVETGTPLRETLESLLKPVTVHLRSLGTTELGWLGVEQWPARVLPLLGFQRVNWINTWQKEGYQIPDLPESAVWIRSAEVADMESLAAIEKDAFEPLWRHSAESLAIALGRSMAFDVAYLSDQLVGFQYSVRGHDGRSAHLVRITVSPQFQGVGVGSALMREAIHGYRRVGTRQVTLNTQTDNTASHRLYEKFGFRRVGDKIPVWALRLQENGTL